MRQVSWHYWTWLHVYTLWNHQNKNHSACTMNLHHDFDFAKTVVQSDAPACPHLRRPPDGLWSMIYHGYVTEPSLLPVVCKLKVHHFWLQMRRRTVFPAPEMVVVWDDVNHGLQKSKLTCLPWCVLEYEILTPLGCGDIFSESVSGDFLDFGSLRAGSDRQITFYQKFNPL